MSKKREERKPYRVPGKTMVSVYLPDDLLAALRKAAEDERRGLSAQVEVIVEQYLADKSPEEARQVRAALVTEGYAAT
jgi:hypothetical protein